MFAILRRPIAFALLLTVVACATNQPGVLRSVEAEKELGKEQTPAFLLSKGGVYKRGEAQEYVQALTAKLSKNVIIPDGFDPIPIKILDTNTPSAYALPGGSIYVSRGIIAMSNTEAQLAGVIAHEIGHVVARHSAKAVAANERFILDVIMEERDRLNEETSSADRIKIIEKGINARLGELTSFSKEQELEADAIALQILAASGYASSGYGELLQRLDRWQLRRAKRAGMTPLELETIAARSGYPKLTERVAALGVLSDSTRDEEAKDRLMAVIDGIVFDDRYNGGIVRDSKYWNRQYRISFDVPEQFLPEHGEHLAFLFAKGIVILRIDQAEQEDFPELIGLLGAEDGPFENVVTADVNGIETVKATMQDGTSADDITGEIIFYDLGSHVVSLTLLAKQADKQTSRPLFRTMTKSFRRVEFSEIPRVRLYETQRLTAGDSVESIAQRSTFDGDREAEIRLLNNVQVGESLTAGDWIKSIR